MLNFEWDERKAAFNLAKHKVSFVAACEVFNDPDALMPKKDQWAPVRFDGE